MFLNTIRYIKRNLLETIVITYILFSSIIKATIGIDICIPCLWKTIFGIRCPGCGLTTAFIYLLNLDFKKAFETNFLIFIILPIGFYLIMNDYTKFVKNYKE